MRPIFKYSGGKSRELKRITQMLPDNFTRVIEPFAGSAAVAFHLEKPAILADIRENNIRVFEQVRDNFDLVFNYLETLKTKTIEELEKEYYYQRDDQFGVQDPVEAAIRWIVLRQLCFSGMDRINVKTGKFNVPFAWYPKFACNLHSGHRDLLQHFELILGDWSTAYDLARPDDFVFLDPPYFNRNSEYGGETEGWSDEETLHREIAEKFRTIKTQAMMVHIDCPLYRELYHGYTIIQKDYTYSQNFKGRDNSGAKVGHLYILNYNPTDLLDKLDPSFRVIS
jgi:DNA adenine methylase